MIRQRFRDSQESYLSIPISFRNQKDQILYPFDVYGDIKYIWVILMINNIIDPSFNPLRLQVHTKQVWFIWFQTNVHRDRLLDQELREQALLTLLKKSQQKQIMHLILLQEKVTEKLFMTMIMNQTKMKQKDR